VALVRTDVSEEYHLHLWGNKTLESSQLVARICLIADGEESLFHGTSKKTVFSTHNSISLWSGHEAMADDDDDDNNNNNNMVMDKINTTIQYMHKAPFTVCCKAYPRYELERFKSLITLQMKVICSSETSVLTTATSYKVPDDIFQYLDLLPLFRT
jgi:hypothetical protein